VWCAVWETETETLTEEDDDAEEDGYDGACAETSGHDVLLISAISIDVALAHFNPQVGGVGHGEVARVCDYDGDLIDSTFKEADLQAHLSIVTWDQGKEKIGISGPWWRLLRENVFEMGNSRDKESLCISILEKEIPLFFSSWSVFHKRLNQHSE